ncbi:ribonucleotide reductase subunit alpha [Roseateles oligotrophus]|uniref:Ribonucleotide reductase subunit alpha n=1 Tax=Roseateles oligotrophus TaxID=1769250 RepID=A0ABT2YB16_9BURK|nr:ribonucleotide reductase subunit alpha [Roseateles oligotrophus]MCV2367473.1 ribonucleotide reductase subunit alpha [Roseateles oligotrophus]
MQIANFQDLLNAAAMQSDAQRLLMVFAGATLPADASAQQKAEFEAGQGGELAPLICVDKLPQELGSFEALTQEADQLLSTEQRWQIVFIASLSGSPGQAPGPEQADKALQAMVESIKAGRIAGFIPFNRQGTPVNLQAH